MILGNISKGFLRKLPCMQCSVQLPNNYGGVGYIIIIMQGYIYLPAGVHALMCSFYQVDIIVADIWYAKHLVSQSDLAQSEEEEVPQGEGESLADQLHIPFIRTSAKLRINIEECFHTLLRRVRDFKELSRDERQGMRDKGHCVLL